MPDFAVLPPYNGDQPNSSAERSPDLKRTVLIVEDEREIRDLLVHYLNREGYRTVVAPDGETALRLAAIEPPDAVLLDIFLPKIDGLEVLRKLRAAVGTERVPVIMLTAKGDEMDRVLGLELGADDYIPKPFSPREVVARIKAVLRRTKESDGTEAPDPIFRYGDLLLDVARHEVRINERPVALTSKEFKILQALLSASGRVLSREAILRKAWGEETYVVDRTVDVHIAKLRQKIPFLADAIQTVKDVGYKMKEPPPQGTR